MVGSRRAVRKKKEGGVEGSLTTSAAEVVRLPGT